MKVVTEDLWSVDEKDVRGTVFVVTTNCTLRQDGALVMGRGAAHSAVKRYGPHVAHACGMLIKSKLQQREQHFLVGKKGKPSLEQGTPLPEDDAFPFDPRFYGYINISASIPKTYDARYQIPEEFSIFQVKYDWWSEASTSLIRRSSLMLGKSARRNATWNFRLNYPGIGNGRLDESQVEPLLADLPDNVTICRK